MLPRHPSLTQRSATLFIAVPLFSALLATSAITARHTMDADVDHIISHGIAPMVAPNGAGGVAVVAQIGGRNLFFNYGFADQAEKRPITSDSLFNVGSVRKIFEATLVAQAVLRGELKLDEPVAKYVTELHGDYIRHITIGQLVSHTSGLLLPTDHPPWPQEHFSFAGFYDALNAWTPSGDEQPGKQRIYTHAGYVLLQLVLERRYGTPISTLIDRGVIAPLGMTSTVVPERGPDDRAIMSPEFMRRAVQGYSLHGEAIGLPGNQQSYFDFPGTGQMFSSARDLAILLAACLGERPPSLPRKRGRVSEGATRSAAIDPTGRVPRQSAIRAGDGLGDRKSVRGDDRRQARRPRQCLGLYRAGAGAQNRPCHPGQSRRRASVRNRAQHDLA